MPSSRIGEKAVLLYALATYAPQFILHVANEEALSERFRIGTGTQYLALLIPTFLLLVLVLQEFIPRVLVPHRAIGIFMGRVFRSHFNTLFAIILVGLAINFNLTQGISFRQSGGLLSEAGMGAVLVMLSKPYVYAWFLYHFLLTIRGVHHRRARGARLQSVLFLVALILSLTGSLDVLPILWATLFTLYNPRRLRSIFVSTRRRGAALLQLLKVFVGVPLAVGIVGTMIWIGYINKMGVDGTSDLVARVGVGSIAEQTMIRVSSSYASLISFAEYNLLNVELYQTVVAIPLENVRYRLSLMFGYPVSRPEITQIGRLNYLNYELDTHLERAGASPGLVSSALFAAPFPFGFFLMAVYVVAIIRIVNLPFSSLDAAPRIALPVFILSFVFPLFESPLDYLIFIDPAFAYLVLVLLAFVSASVDRGRRAKAIDGKLISHFGDMSPTEVREGAANARTNGPCSLQGHLAGSGRT